MKQNDKENSLPNLIGETDFMERMNTDVAKFYKDCAADGFFESKDGKKIHYYQCIHPEEKAAIVISHGFCEFFEKYHEVVYYFYQAKYSVFFIEHRGHGHSYREVEELDKVHIRNFEEYIEDFKVFMDQVVTKESKTHQYYLFAHSMGGCIAGLFLEKYPQYFKAAVLSSPMMQMNFRGIPKIAVDFLLVWSKIAHWDTRYVPGQGGFNGKYDYANSCSLSEPRYQYTFTKREQVPELSSYGGTYAWTRESIHATKRVRKNASLIKIPVLLFQAGNDTMVVPEGQEEFIKKVANGKMIVFPDAKHELYNAPPEIRAEYYQYIFNFYKEHLK